jgi:hypothetical protein
MAQELHCCGGTHFWMFNVHIHIISVSVAYVNEHARVQIQNFLQIFLEPSTRVSKASHTTFYFELI